MTHIQGHIQTQIEKKCTHEFPDKRFKLNYLKKSWLPNQIVLVKPFHSRIKINYISYYMTFSIIYELYTNEV